MKLLIASDIHGNYDCCRQLIEAFTREDADRLLLLGDVASFMHKPGRKDLAELLNPIAGRISYVQGNCDVGVDLSRFAFDTTSKTLLLNLDGRIVFATHGHLYSANNPPELLPGSILLTGHTHIPAFSQIGECWYMNPGSVSSPRGNSERGYMLYDGAFSWKTLDGRLIRGEVLRASK